MTITLFEKKDFKGKVLTITRNFRDLSDTPLGKNPSSLVMSENDDAILLFKQKEWDGGVMYYRGKRSMTSLGKLSQGGEFLSGNTIASVRLTPFQLVLNVNVVFTHEVPTDIRSPERLPGDEASRSSLENTFGKAVVLANQFFDREKAMLRLEVARYDYRLNDGKFDLTSTESGSFVADWKNAGEVDVIIANTLKGGYGQAKLPWWGKTLIVTLAGRSINEVARTLAHELGHYLGLTHMTGSGSAPNIMTPSDLGLDIGQSVLTPDQIEEMHTKLSKNLTRQGDRR